jgi:hypothetical protein
MSVFGKFQAQAAVTEIATRIIAGDVYKPDLLEAIDREADRQATSLRPAVLAKLAIVRLRRVEVATQNADKEIDAKLDRLRETIEAALSNTPTDAFLWSVLYWVHNAQLGFSEDNIRNLQMSYETGPYEGWVARRRNGLALAVFPMLPASMAQSVTSEFSGMVRTPLNFVAADNLKGPGWPIREALLASLRPLSERDRQSFAALLNERDLRDVVVPGIAPQPLRPWVR